MRFPVVFVNHGGGPLPLLGQQSQVAEHMKILPSLLPSKPKSILLISAHWEADPVRITSSPRPSMMYDYYGFPPETYEYKYPAPGNPDLAQKVHSLLQSSNISSELDADRGYDHGVFVPLMLMYPDAEIPVVALSLHTSLSAKKHLEIGKALHSIRDEDVLIIGSGYTFHNMKAFFHPSDVIRQGSRDFNVWLRETILGSDLNKLEKWEEAPGARMSHPREEHLLPLMVVAGAAGESGKAKVIYDTTLSESADDYAVTGYMIQ